LRSDVGVSRIAAEDERRAPLDELVQRRPRDADEKRQEKRRGAAQRDERAQELAQRGSHEQPEAQVHEAIEVIAIELDGAP